jgi:hypothetical protein
VIGAIVATALLRCSIGDNADGRLVALVGVLVCLSELARRAGATTLSIAGSDWRRHFPAIGCLFLAVLFMSQETINRALAWQSYAEQVFSQAATESPDNPQTLAGLIVPMNGQNRFVIPDENGCNPELTRLRAANATSDLFASEYLHTVKDGIVLLRAVDHRSKTVFTFDAVNPFPYAVEMQPPRNGYPLFWIGGRVTSNPQLLPRPEDLLRDVDLVMVPRLPYSASQLSHMVRIYGSYLTLNYVPLSESTCWELWTRNTR